MQTTPAACAARIARTRCPRRAGCAAQVAAHVAAHVAAQVAAQAPDQPTARRARVRLAEQRRARLTVQGLILDP
jgi:hypothetical protein